ncbi:hypothetical protein AVEN_73368-1 [Araneus ventricosus]|uniref:Uncharacterized protein n=1 Tax=Araneus ventricosus TaxID=182803 RepID=A0A4Y2U5R6_ARAVE|nr:hypothetical protein AVEN_267040-1 [Araneus ventricosus]GBO07029.1 hypothetical protein AVEN_73368-1 [Araneus ventricosus]
MGIWWKQSYTQDNVELRFILKYASERHVAQVTGTITLVQISNINRQPFTCNDSNSTFAFRNTNSQQITNNDSNSTFNSAQLTGFPARTADKTPKPLIEGVRTPFIYPCSTSCYVTWKYLAHSSISAPNGDFEKIIAYSGIFDLSPRSPNSSSEWSPSSSPKSGVQAWPLPVISCLPL